jgi:hypothetical protein
MLDIWSAWCSLRLYSMREEHRVGLAELSVMEQRFHAVMECLGGTPKTEVAARCGVSRQTIHNWLAR